MSKYFATWKYTESTLHVIKTNTKEKCPPDAQDCSLCTQKQIFKYISQFRKVMNLNSPRKLIKQVTNHQTRDNIKDGTTDLGKLSNNNLNRLTGMRKWNVDIFLFSSCWWPCMLSWPPFLWPVVSDREKTHICNADKQQQCIRVVGNTQLGGQCASKCLE